MSTKTTNLTHCFVDESIHESIGCVSIAFVFSSAEFEDGVSKVLQKAGLNTPIDEFKSSTRMDTNPLMRKARNLLLTYANSNAKIAVFFGPFNRLHIGRQAMQALQSVLIRNAISPTNLSIHFDNDIFPSVQEATRIHSLFHSLKDCKIYPREDSRIRVGIQVSDAVAHSFGQILKQSITGSGKMIDTGGEDTGYADGTKAPLGWSLLMTLRYSLFTRPVIYNGEPYDIPSDPVVLDPQHDDPVEFHQHPVLVGWGIQVAPESSGAIRQAVEQELGRLWLGCIH